MQQHHTHRGRRGSIMNPPPLHPGARTDIIRGNDRPTGHLHPHAHHLLQHVFKIRHTSSGKVVSFYGSEAAESCRGKWTSSTNKNGWQAIVFRGKQQIPTEF